MGAKLQAVRCTNTLYAQLGGKANIAAAVDKLYEKVFADPDLKPFFAKINMTWLKLRQTQFLTQALGGPAEYKGRSMKPAHTQLPIEPWQFQRVATHLALALSEMNVPPQVVDGVMEKISALEPEIVTAPGKGFGPADSAAQGACGTRSIFLESI
jgi:hemoglobin